MKRLRRNSRGMLPVYRDVHPDRCPVEWVDENGAVVLSADLPETMVLACDRQAKKNRVSFQTLIARIVIDQIDRRSWGKLSG